MIKSPNPESKNIIKAYNKAIKKLEGDLEHHEQVKIYCSAGQAIHKIEDLYYLHNWAVPTDLLALMRARLEQAHLVCTDRRKAAIQAIIDDCQDQIRKDRAERHRQR